MNPLRPAFRSLCRHLRFSALVILLVALGVGASTAIFGVVYAVLLKPLPYPAPGELVLVRKPLHDAAAALMASSGDLMPDNEFLGWIEAAPKSFRSLAGYTSASSTLQIGDHALQVPVANVTGGFFSMLGVSPWRGRFFGAGDLKPGAAPTVLSYAVWQSQFHGDDAALGRVVKLDDVAHTIIGVLPPSFEFIDPVQFWRPLPLEPNAPGQLRIRMIRAFGRLLPTTSIPAAQQELDGISQRFWNELPLFAGPGPRMAATPFADANAQLVPLREQLAGRARATLWILLGAVGFVLLIAGVNIANLQLARAAGRQRETAVRAALGASPRSLALQLMTENLLLALAGGLLGVLLAWWGTQGLQAWLAGYLPRITPITVNGPVLTFALLVALGAGIGFGLAPAWYGSRVNLLAMLKEGGHPIAAGGNRLRLALVAVEVALAFVLAVNTGLLAQSLYQLYSAELGYRTEDVLTASLTLPRSYGAADPQRAFAERWLTELKAMPGSRHVALADVAPLSPYSQVVFAMGERPRENAAASTPPRTMAIASVTPDFFSATGTALREGRFFSVGDDQAAPAVAIVNEEFVRQFHPGGALGQSVNLPRGSGHGDLATATIVGVVANTRPRGLESSPQPMAYFPLAQLPGSRMTAVVQFAGDATPVRRAMLAAVQRVDPSLAPDQPETLAEKIARQTAPRRVTLILAGVFAGTALLLAALGIFGLMSYTVMQRTPEVGIRMALGAAPRNIATWLLRYAGIAVGVGLCAGVALALASTRLLHTLSADVSGGSGWLMLEAAALLVLVALLACLGPGFRAMRINPVDVLRQG